MQVFLRCELFIKVKSARYLEDMLPAVVLHLSSFTEGHKGVVDAQCWWGPEGWSVGQWMVWDGLPVFALFPDECQHFIIFLHLCPFWKGILVVNLLHPMVGQQEANL